MAEKTSSHRMTLNQSDRNTLPSSAGIAGHLSNSSTLEDSLLHSEQARVLYGGLPLALLFNVLLSTMLVTVMWPIISFNLATVWLLLMGVALIGRLGIYVWYRRKNSRLPAAQWLKIFRITIVASGLVWGTAAYAFFPNENITYQVFLAFVIAGVSSAAITSLAPDRRSALSFIIPALLPLVYHFANAGGTMPFSMGLMVLLFLVFLSAASVRLEKNLRENIYLRGQALEQRNALRENEQRFHYILDTCPTAVRISKTGFFEVVYFNQSYVKLLEATPDQVLGINPIKYYVNKEDYADIVKELGNGEAVFDRLIELHIPEQPDLPHKWTLATYLRIEYQGEPAVIGWFHDISERIQMDRMKNEFVSTVSHELRTPLTVISGSLGLLAGGAITGLPDTAKQMVDLAYKNSLRLTRLINDLLDMDKLAAGKVELNMQTMQIMPLIEQAITENKNYAASRHVGITLSSVSPETRVVLDSHRFLQVMANLISNALKFSPNAATVDITVVVKDKNLRVSVIDCGMGIPAEFHGRIFQKFSQADSSDTRPKGGTGLGLAITKELVERMGGQIGFDSVEGRGATFYVEFPIGGM
jgi:signal transduction histidine kinase